MILDPNLRLLVCGGRHYNDKEHLEKTLDSIAKLYSTVNVCHGGANGADRLAGNWAKSRGFDVATYPALWKRDGINAGPIRNLRMIQLFKPNLVVAFPGGTGTRDMITKAKKAGILVIRE